MFTIQEEVTDRFQPTCLILYFSTKIRIFDQIILYNLYIYLILQSGYFFSKYRGSKVNHKIIYIQYCHLEIHNSIYKLFSQIILLTKGNLSKYSLLSCFINSHNYSVMPKIMGVFLQGITFYHFMRTNLASELLLLLLYSIIM